MGTTRRPLDGPSSACLTWACTQARGLGAVSPTPRQEAHARPSRLRTGPDCDTPATSCRTAASPRHARRDPRASWQRRRAPRGSHRACDTTTAATRGVRGHGVPRRRSAPRPRLQRRRPCRRGTPGTGHTPTHAGGRRVSPLACPTRRLACLARATRFPPPRTHRPRRGVAQARGPLPHGLPPTPCLALRAVRSPPHAPGARGDGHRLPPGPRRTRRRA